MRVLFNSSVWLFCLLFSVISAIAAPGDLDTAFGNNGKVFINSLNAIDFLRTDTVIQADGKILVVSNNWTGFSAEMIVARFNENGSFDASFGNSGILQISFGGFLTAGSALALQSDGKIVVAGVSNVGTSPDANFSLVRLNPNGTLDVSFGNGGKVTTSFDAGFNDFAQSVAVQFDGKIVVAGYSINGLETQSFFAIARYNTNGSLDTSFDTDGKLTATASNRPLNDGYAVAIQNDGKIVIGGGVYEEILAASEFALIRLNPNGSFDTSFDSDGKVQIIVAGQDERIHDLKIQPDGKIIAVGYSDTDLAGSGNDDFAAIRLNSNGSLDTSFSNDGKITFTFNPQNEIEQAWGVEIQQNGKIVISGFSGKADPNQEFPILNAVFATVRLNNDGTTDNSFGINGAVTTSFQTPLNLGFRNALQNDGKIVQIGYTGDQDPETLDSKITIVRYNGDEVIQNNSRPIFDFDGDSKTDLSIFRPSVGQWWYLKSSDGGSRVYQFGQSTDILTPGDFTGDGKTDICFFRPAEGKWYVLRSEDSSFFTISFGTIGDIPVPSDFDGDGKTDSAVFRPSSATWFILRSSNGGTTIQGFGLNGDKPVIADYDGDGKSDIAIYRPSNGQWWYQKSSNGQVTALQFGTSTDRPIQGDYTGDGKADIGFFRPSTGEWFILRSEDLSFFSFPFGTNGDIPAPGDYDGDGRIDPAVFRPSSNTWYINRTTSGLLIVNFGGSGDQPVPAAFVP